MTQYQDLLDEAIGEPPPSTVDIEEVITRQRRRTRFLRYGTAGSAAAVALTVAVVFAAIPTQPGPGQVGPGGPPPTSSPPQTSPPAPVRDSQQMTTALTAAMRAALPDATFHPNRPAGEKQVAALVFDLHDNDHGTTDQYATAEIRDKVGISSIEVTINRYGASEPDEMAQVCGDGKPLDLDVFDCHMQNVGDGSRALLITTAHGKWTRHMVRVFKPDGVSVHIELINSTAKEIAGTTYFARRPTPHLTRAQVLQVALLPEFTLTS